MTFRVIWWQLCLLTPPGMWWVRLQKTKCNQNARRLTVVVFVSQAPRSHSTPTLQGMSKKRKGYWWLYVSIGCWSEGVYCSGDVADKGSNTVIISPLKPKFSVRKMNSGGASASSLGWRKRKIAITADHEAWQIGFRLLCNCLRARESKISLTIESVLPLFNHCSYRITPQRF